MTKTITIDSDAFDRLEKARRPDESLSEVIRRCVRSPRSADEVLAALREADVSDETLDAIDESVNRRRRVPRRRST